MPRQAGSCRLSQTLGLTKHILCKAHVSVVKSGMKLAVLRISCLMSHCHCSKCRKFSGSAFLTFARVDRTQFRWSHGEGLASSYESSQGSYRCFCSNCGSPLPVVRADLMNVLIPAGTIDDDPGCRPSLHIFSASKASWYEITDGLPQCAEWPENQSIESLGRGEA